VGYRSSKFKIGDVVRFKDRCRMGYDNDWTTERGTVISHNEMFMITAAEWISADNDEYWSYTLVNDRLKDAGWGNEALEIVIPRAGPLKSGKIKTPRQPASVQPEGA
jgi:hypothetical protein